ncbi:hypothetical protein K439DRAFT_1095261 [Ramaria rubella]|nr:hypothetical protein K439DRAFT_1095261 [Ramaria rubella]
MSHCGSYLFLSLCAYHVLFEWFAGLFNFVTYWVAGHRVACGALLAFEYLLTLDREIFYVWGSKWSLGKIIFFLNRYGPVADTVLAIYILTGVKDQETCPVLARAILWLFVSGMFISETILAMRTYAIWSGRREILIFLVVFTLAVFASASVLTQRFLNSLTFIDIPPFLKSLGVGVTCAPTPLPRATYPEFLVFMVNQAVVAVLTIYRGLQQYRISRHPVVRTMFQDGKRAHISIFLDTRLDL